MATLPILTVQAAERLLTTLEEYLEKSEASYAMVIDRGGIILSQHGSLPGGADATVLAALSAGSFAATRELAMRVGEPDCNALYQQGTQSHILISAVDGDLALVTVFGPRTTVGLVKFYSAKTIKTIRAVLNDSRAHARHETVFTSQDVDAAGTLFES